MTVHVRRQDVQQDITETQAEHVHHAELLDVVHMKQYHQVRYVSVKRVQVRRY